MATMRLATVGRILVIGLATVPAWFFGGVQASCQIWLLAATVGALVCWVFCEIWEARAPLPLPWVLLPLFLGLGLIAFQVAPLPAAWREVLSPQGEAWRRASVALASSGAPDAEAPQPWAPLSLYPASSRGVLAKLALATAVFVAAAGLLSTRRWFLVLATAVAVNGAALAFFGLVQKLTWNGEIYWRFPLTHGGAPFASFVNRNHAAGYLALCLAGAIGVGIWASSRTRELDVDYFGGALGDRLRSRMAALVAGLDGTVLGIATLAAVIVGGMFATLSRGGVVSLVGASLILGVVVLHGRRPVRLAGIAMVIAAACFLVSWVGMNEASAKRMGMLFRNEGVAETRLAHWRDAARAVPDFWRIGSGAGTYRYLYRPYERRSHDVWFYHAENQYLEATIEAGLLGLALLLLAIGLVTAAALSLVRQRNLGRFAAGAAAIFALASQAIHACVDFGLYVPSNFLLLAVLCGGACGMAARMTHRNGPVVAFAFPGTTLAVGGAAILAVVIGLGETAGLAAVEAGLRQARWDGPADEVAMDQIRGAIARLDQALQRRPGDLEGRKRLAELHVLAVRRHFLERVLDEQGSQQAPRDELWMMTSPTALQAQLQQALRTGVEVFPSWRRDPVVRRDLEQALEHLRQARVACPLSPEVELDFAELNFLISGQPGNKDHVELGMKLAPADAALRFRCGYTDLAGGRLDRAAANWRRCLELDPKFAPRVLHLAAARFTMEEIVEEVLPHSPSLLLDVAADAYAAEAHAYQRGLLVARAEKLLAEQATSSGETMYLWGRANELKGDRSRAIECYERAVEMQPGALAWRFSLASAYLKDGRLDEAHEQARRCVRMAPDFQPGVDLLKELYRSQLRQ